MLHPVSKLAENVLRYVGRILGHEINAYSLASDQPDDLLNLVHEGLGSAVEQHVGLIEEENKLRKVHIPDFRQPGIELRKQPEQEGGIELRIEHQLVRCQNAHHSLAAFALEKVIYIE